MNTTAKDIPTILHHTNFTAVRVERLGFVFIAHLATNYRQVPGFSKVEVYRSRDCNKHGIEWWVGYLSPQQIGRMLPALTEAVRVAYAAEREKARLPQTKVVTYRYDFVTHMWRTPTEGVSREENERNLQRLGYVVVSTKDAPFGSPLGQLQVTYRRAALAVA